MQTGSMDPGSRRLVREDVFLSLFIDRPSPRNTRRHPERAAIQDPCGIVIGIRRTGSGWRSCYRRSPCMPGPCNSCQRGYPMQAGRLRSRLANGRYYPFVGARHALPARAKHRCSRQVRHFSPAKPGFSGPFADIVRPSLNSLIPISRAVSDVKTSRNR